MSHNIPRLCHVVQGFVSTVLSVCTTEERGQHSAVQRNKQKFGFSFFLSQPSSFVDRNTFASELKTSSSREKQNTRKREKPRERVQF